jgi:hypothetical protein
LDLAAQCDPSRLIGMNIFCFERYNKTVYNHFFIIHICEHYMFRLLRVIIRCLT